MLTRSLFEDMIDLHWASACADVAAGCFQRHMLLSWLSRAEDGREHAVNPNRLADAHRARGAWLNGRPDSVGRPGPTRL